MHPHNNYQELVYLIFHSLPFIPSITHAPFKNYLRNISLIPPLPKFIKGITTNNLTPPSSQHNLSKTKPHNFSTPLTYNKQTLTHINTSIIHFFVVILFQLQGSLSHPLNIHSKDKHIHLHFILQ
jgi:hypothetical protein